MCYYITIAVPADSSEHDLRRALRAHGKTFSPLGETASARKLIDADVHYGITTREHCDCDTVVGSLTRATPEYDEEDLQRRNERKKRKLKRKGWSASRIDKWVEQQKRAEETNADRADEQSTAGAEQWTRILRSLVEVSSNGRAWLLLHAYSGQIETAGIKLRRRETVPLKNITPDFILNVEEDVLYELRQEQGN